MAQSTLTQFQILPRPRWRGFSFALHRHGAGLFFLPGGVSASHNRLRLSFCRQCNYTTTTPKPFTGLYRGFSVDLPYSSAHNTAVTQAACAAPEDIPSSAAPPQIPDTTTTLDAVQGRAAAYYNKVYIRVRFCYGSMPDGASFEGSVSPPVQGQPGGVSMLLTPGGLRSGTGSTVISHKASLEPSTRRNSPVAGRAARNHWRLVAASLFGLSADNQ